MTLLKLEGTAYQEQAVLTLEEEAQLSSPFPLSYALRTWPVNP